MVNQRSQAGLLSIIGKLWRSVAPFAGPALLGVPISALHDTSVPVEELGRGRLGGMAHGGRTGLTVLSVLVSKPWKCDFSTYKVSGIK